MKRIVASVGMVALGASGVQAAGDAVSSPEPVKPWSVSASLRGFYDDNINSSAFKQDAVGYEVSPSLLWKETWETSSLSFGYTYAFRYYDHKPIGNADNFDQDHTFNAAFDHRFNERYAMSVTDSFVVGQEPDTLRTGVAFNSFSRVPGANIRNAGAINLDAQMTHTFGLQLGYANSYYDYAANGALPDPTITFVVPSISGELSRIEHNAHLDGRVLLQRETTGVIGYSYRETDYTGGELIGGAWNGGLFDPSVNAQSDSRNSRVHSLYVGVDHNFRPDLMLSLRAGAQYSDYFNDPNQSGQVSPYAQISLRYTYAQESYLEAGFSYDRVATDLVGGTTSTNATTLATKFHFTTDAEAAVVYATWNHRITPKLFGSVTAQFQDSTYNNGALNNEDDKFYLVGLNLEYRFNPHFSANIGYNYDKLDSDVTGFNRSYDRNRVYIGIAASY